MSVVITSSIIAPVPMTVVPASAVIIGTMIIVMINGTGRITRMGRVFRDLAGSK
jgi:hypothetical protein